MNERPQHPRRPWTPKDDALLRKFHAEGKDDKSIGYIIDRRPNVVHRHRKALGLKANGRPGTRKGTYRHTDASKAKIRAYAAQRWQADAQYRETVMAALDRGRETNTAKRWRMPTDPAELRVYKKFRALMGADRAKAALSEKTSTTDNFAR